uniref:Protein kinase n=1 Tax=Kalmanozyma brasiliensis (strain GHG001) TaxID=1365824 RepID=V5F3K3_KALBG
MPLEQIRPVAALNSSESLRRQSYFGSPQASSSNHLPFSRDDAGSDSDRENADENDDVPYYDRFKRHSTSSVRSDPMSLAKLGGVGGVTRSGSWGRNSLPDTSSSSRQPLRAQHSMLARYQEEDDGEHEDYAVSASDDAHQRSPDRGHSLLSRSNDSSKPTEAPASSRTSTASSAAAFSLRSLSDRNSTGSASSLASSAVSPSSDSEHLTSTPPAESSSIGAKPASETACTGPSQSPSPSATAPSSPAHHHAVAAAEIAEARATDQEDISDSTSQGTADAATPSVDCVGASDEMSAQSTDPTHTQRATSNRSTSSSILGLLQSPTPSGIRGQRVDSPLSNAGLSPNAVEVLSSSVTNAYSPLIPRKHSGAIMLRSRSQLALHPGLSMTFANAEGGRAAARERARKNTGWENAPFSVLEAQRHARAAAFSQPASPGSTAAAAPVAWDASTPVFVLQPAARVTEQATTTSLQSSPRPSHRPASTSQTPPPLSLPPRSVDSGENSRRPSLVPRQKSEHSLSRAALARLDTVLGLQVNDRLEPAQSSSADAATLSMPTGVRNLHSRSPSGSAVVGANGLMRTPTTEEWSRYLESQGVGLAGRRSRTGTNRSTSSRFALTGLQSSARSDIDAGTGDYDDDSDADSDDSDSHDLGAEVLEKLKQLGLSRAASRAGSVLGDELMSLHEEDEDDFSPVSPQTDRILPHTDLEPLTPLASDKMVLAQIQGGPLANLHGGPSTSQAPVDRGITVRLPRSKRPTLLNEVHNVSQLYPHEHNANKSIADFEIVSDIGRGAYGLVKKARMKGLDGRPQGEEVIIKYIIKSRILADCWRRHRVLGPIPVEIHVMDQLRRIAYVAPTKARPWSPSQQALEDKDIDITPLDPAWSPRKDKEGADPDGGGRVDDFVDLISRCLELDAESRPSAEQICQHRFLAGFAGWTGPLGWQRLRSPIVPSCTIASEGKGSTILSAAATAAL